jgi:vesicular inhibitory amino acid transporter
MAIVQYLIVAGNNLSLIFGGLAPVSVVTIGSGAIFFCLMFVPEEYLAKFSQLGMICQAALLVSLILSIAFIARSDPASLGTDTVMLPSDSSAMMAVLGCFISVYNAHSTMPTLYQKMEKKQHWLFAVSVGTVLALLFYASIGILGYVIFGNGVHQAFTQNLGVDAHGQPVPYMHLAAPIAGGLIGVKMLVSLPMSVTPILNFSKKYIEKTTALLLFKIIFVSAVTFFAVCASDLFAMITAIQGAVVHPLLAILMPFACFLSLAWTQLKFGAKCFFVVLIIICFGATIPGSVVDLQIIFTE